MTVYPPLHSRSCYSLMKGILTPREICRMARQEGARAAGLADVNSFYGLVEFHREARAAGLKPVTALEVVRQGTSLFSAFVLDRRGFALLNELITRMHDPSGEDLHPVEFLLRRGWEGLALASDRPEVLEALGARDRTDLYAALFRGRPFHSFFLWARERGIPPLALSAGVFRDSGERRLHSLLRAIDTNRVIQDLPPEERLPDWRSFAGSRELASCFSAVPQALENCLALADRAEGELFPGTFVFPRFNGQTEARSLEELRSLCLQGIRRRYPFPSGGGSPPGKGSPSGGTPSPREVRARLDRELEIIGFKGFAGYFLVVHDIVSRFPRTCGRGSSAASIVSYLLGITHVDPLRYNLFFERFLHRERQDPPDIDVDFPWDEREQALAYVFRRYPGRAGMVADHVTFAGRSCVREAARAFGFPREDATRMIRAWRNGQGDPLPGYILRAARALQGRPRYIGTHPGGVVITPEPLFHYTHSQPGGTGFPVIAWEKEGTEGAGLVKIDLLGNRSLGVLRDAISLVNPGRISRGEPPLEWESFQPVGDPEVRRFIETGDTLGIFYVESPATRQLLKKMGRGDFPNLVVASSIIRPAANRWIGEFVRRLKGEEFVPPPGPVEEVLRETMGIMVYQEDVARVAMAAAGFSASEADRLRKIMSKKDRELRLPDFRRRFFEGGLRRGCREGELEELWEGILSFQGYSFCKAHSASYALVSYRLAWMKLHHPLEFFTCVINNGGGFYSRQVYLNALRRLGIPLLPPDVNASSPLYAPEGGALRLGLVQLAGTDRNFLARILEERESRGKYRDYNDFLERLSPSFGEIRPLIRAGALDSLAGGATRPQLFWMFYHRRGPGELFGLPRPPRLGEYPEMQRLADEVKFLNLLVSRHPLEVFMPRIRTLLEGRGEVLEDSRSLSLRSGSRILLAGTLVTEKETVTRQSRAMSFVSFEDPHGIFETVFFPETHEAFSLLLETGFAFLIRGKVEEEHGVFQIQAEELIPLNRPSGPGFPGSPSVPGPPVQDYPALCRK